jgi:hypothetical protein
LSQAKPVYTLSPVGLLDRTDTRITTHTGQLVQKVQPAGTPRNGVMGMCFVQHADTGQLIGQVCESSLTPTGERQVPRDLAREARERRAASRCSTVHTVAKGRP